MAPGGVAGRAGLFGTGSDIAVFAQMLLNGGTYEGVRIVSDSTVHLFTARASGSRALGWEVADGSHGAGNYLGEGAYGHTGFTGTSIWIDPANDLFVVLLTNRVNPTRANTKISRWRQALADAVVSAAASAR